MSQKIEIVFLKSFCYSHGKLINKIIFKIQYIQFICHGPDTKLTKEVTKILKSVLILMELKIEHERLNNNQSLGRMFREQNKGNVIRVP